MHFFKLLTFVSMSVLALGGEQSENTSDKAGPVLRHLKHRPSAVTTSRTELKKPKPTPKINFLNTAKPASFDVAVPKISTSTIEAKTEAKPTIVNNKSSALVTEEQQFTKVTDTPVSVVAANPTPDCIAVCFDNAWVFSDCEDKRKDCVCIDHHFQWILYYCLKSICDPIELSKAVQSITSECAPFLPSDEHGEIAIFHDTQIQQQGPLHARDQRHGRAISGPSGPTGPRQTESPQDSEYSYPGSRRHRHRRPHGHI